MKNHFRLAATIRLTEGQAVAALDQALAASLVMSAETVLMRPGAFVAIIKAEPKLIEWQLCRDCVHRPVWRGRTVEISDELYSDRRA